ncbi:MAG: substrate-binding periplasmic protein [Pseudomonas sp.]
MRSGRYTATPPTFKDEAPDFSFPAEPVSANRFCFYTAQADAWTYAGVASLEGRSVGIIQNYAYGAELDALIRRQPQSFRLNSGNDLTLRLIQQLQHKRFDTFVEEENLVNYTLLRHPGYALRVAGCEAEKFAYMAISPKHPRHAEYARMFSAGMQEIRRHGVLDKILSAYGLRDWRD